MKKKIALVVSVVSVAVALTLAFATFPGFGQERNRTVNSTAPETSLTKKEALIVEKNAPTAVTSVASTVSPVWAQAATQNSSLRTGLNWLFGGKQQHGWYLYSGLIGQLLQTDRDSGAPEFALALSSWQQKTGLAPTGILDGDTLYKMVDTWQSIRSKDHTYPSPDQLITAPPSEFLHPERPAE